MMSKKTFSCTSCGHPFTCYPPDDAHPYAARNKADLHPSGVIQIDYTCENSDCNAINTLYWGHPKTPFGVI